MNNTKDKMIALQQAAKADGMQLSPEVLLSLIDIGEGMDIQEIVSWFHSIGPEIFQAAKAMEQR